MLPPVCRATIPMSTARDPTLYDCAAPDWWSGSVRWIRTLANMVPARMRYFEQVVPEWSGADVLDIGCAGGFLTEELARRGARVSGIDPAGDAIAAARSHATQEGLSIDYRLGIGEQLPWPDDSFDVVTCVDVLEHVGSVDRVLAEAARVLRPGGWLLFDTINRNPLSAFLVITMAERILGLLPDGAHDPDLFIKPRELRRKLEAAGFVVEPFAGLGPTGINRRGDFTFGRLPITLVIYIGAARLETVGR